MKEQEVYIEVIDGYYTRVDNITMEKREKLIGLCTGTIDPLDKRNWIRYNSYEEGGE